MDEGKLRGEQDRGEKAKAVLRNPIMVEAFEELGGRYIETWKATSIEQESQREKIFQMYQALLAVQGHLEELVSTGELAKIELNDKSLRRR